MRIPDLPDLGDVTDNAFFAGDLAGSGRFRATAIRDYITPGITSPIAVEIAALTATIAVLTAALTALTARVTAIEATAMPTALAALTTRVAAIEAGYIKVD